MIRLLVMRHAKSSWKLSELGDFERPLNNRGERDAPRMGRHLASRVERIDRIVTSSAVRALATARLVARELELSEDAIDARPSLYLADPRDILAELRELESEWRTVLLLGHNPGVTELVRIMTGAELEELPTGAVALLELAVDAWSDLREGSALLRELALPKELED